MELLWLIATDYPLKIATQDSGSLWSPQSLTVQMQPYSEVDHVFSWPVIYTL